MNELIWTPVQAVRLQDLEGHTQKRIADSITANFRSWKDQRRGYEEVWREIDRHVNQYDPLYTPEAQAEKSGWQFKVTGGLGSKLKMTNVFSHREGLVAAVMRYLMQNDYDFFDIPVLDPVDDDKAQAVKQYLMWLFDVMDFEASFTPFCRDIVQYGTGIAAYEWHREQVPRWKRAYETDPMTGATIVLDYEAQEVVYDAPKFTPINLYYAVLDPTAENVKTATLIFKRAVTPHEIMANTAFSNIDWSFVNGANNFAESPDTVLETDRKHAQGDENFNASEAYGDKKELYEAWGDFTDGQTVYKNYVANVLNGRLIRFEPNPYMMPHKPFVVARYAVETNRVYGRSPLASITGIQAGYDTISNQYIDYWSMEINRPILVQANTIVRTAKEDRSKLPPISKDAAWTVRDTNGIKRLDWGGRTANMDPTAILGLFEQQMERATGDNALISGGSPDRYVNTGVAVTAADAGSAKLNLYAKSIEKEAIIPVLEMTVDLLRQMQVPEKTFKRKDAPGAEPLTFEPSLLLNDIRFSMRGASYNMTKQIQVQSMQQFFQQLAQNPLTAQLINWPKAIKVLGEAMGIRNIVDLINPMVATMMQQMPSAQPSFMQKVAGFFGGNPKTVEDTQLGNQFTGGLAPAFGGVNDTSQAPSPFDFTSAR